MAKIHNGGKVSQCDTKADPCQSLASTKVRLFDIFYLWEVASKGYIKKKDSTQ